MTTALVEIQRRVALGSAMGAVIHDLRNALTVIQLHANDGLGASNVPEPLQASFREILTACARASAISDEVSSRLKPRVALLEPIDLNDLLKSLLPKLQASTKNSIGLHLAEGPVLVQGRRIDLEYLVIHAIDASSRAQLAGSPFSASTRVKDGHAIIEFFPISDQLSEASLIELKLLDSALVDMGGALACVPGDGKIALRFPLL